jgi:hypothetical protein
MSLEPVTTAQRHERIQRHIAGVASCEQHHFNDMLTATGDGAGEGGC